MVWRRLDGAGLLIVGIAVAGLIQFRLHYVEPRAWDVRCAAGAAPLVCGLRAASLWLQDNYVWGVGGLVLGLGALVRGARVVCISAVVIGVAGVLNYNASWGMLGAALGVWGWIRRPPARHATDP